MKIFRTILTLVIVAGSLGLAQLVVAQEAPDALVKRISQDVVNQAKADKGVQSGNRQRVQALVEAKILPYVDFEHMTALTAGADWRKATPEQQKQLIKEYRALLVHTYSGAISQIKDQTVTFKPMRADAGSTEVEVRSTVVQPRGEPIQLNYRLEKKSGGWKIYDMNIMGSWLVATYKTTFASEISKGGIDGLIKTLAEKNKNLAAGRAKDSKPS